MTTVLSTFKAHSFLSLVLASLVLLLTSQWSQSSDFASIKFDAILYNYVGVAWLENNIAIGVGYSATGGSISRTGNAGWTWTSTTTLSDGVTSLSGVYGIATRKFDSVWYAFAVNEVGEVYQSTDTGTRLTWICFTLFFFLHLLVLLFML
jgi:hypothetical protein